MLTIDNKVIETPIKDLLEKLKAQLVYDHINKLSQIRYKQGNAIICCPIHKDGQETVPSCDVLLEDKDGVQAGTVHCFACGYKASFTKFVADCRNISFKEANEWILEVSTYSLLEHHRDIELFELVDKLDNEEDLDDCSFVPIEDLEKYEYIHPYMFKRKLTDDIIKKFEVGYDPVYNAITFPVYVNGVCKFVCKRSVDIKRFYMPPMKEKPIYGLDYITDDEIYVCESIINALTIWSYGKQAVALFGTGSSKQIETLKNLPQRKLILALDGDDAGRKGTQRIKEALTNKIVMVLDVPNGKDINDLSLEEFKNLKCEI